MLIKICGEGERMVKCKAKHRHMNDVDYFIKSRKFPAYAYIGVGLIVILLVVIVPILVDFVFTRQARFSFMAVSWGASTALLYYASVLSFFGSFSLGLVAIWQTRKAYNRNEKAFAIGNAAIVCLSDFSIKFGNKICRKSMHHKLQMGLLAQFDAPEPLHEIIVNIQLRQISGFVSLVKVREASLYIANKNNTAGKPDVKNAWCVQLREDDFLPATIVDEHNVRFAISLYVNDNQFRTLQCVYAGAIYTRINILLDVVTHASVMTHYECDGVLSTQGDKSSVLCFDTITPENAPISIMRDTPKLISEPNIIGRSSSHL
jgi:hypothetical protein